MAIANREERRRRVLREDHQVGAATGRSARKTKADGARYTPAAQHEQLHRLVDVIPKRPIWICLWFTLGLLSLGTLCLLDHTRREYLGQIPAEKTTALAISGTGTLANWWATVCLLGSAGLSAVIYTIRCHRVDDYRGRYRQWILMTLLCALGSACVATPIHQTFQALVVQLTERTWWHDGVLWWMLPLSGIATVAGIRALLDMRPCKSAPVALVVAAGCYVAAALGHLGILNAKHVSTSLWLPMAVLLAHYCLFWSFCLFARYVYLEAQGQLGEKPKKRNRRRAPKAQSTDDREVIKLSQQQRSNKSSKHKSKTAAEEVEAERELELDELEVLTDPNLTRSERRKLRKKLKRDQRRAA